MTRPAASLNFRDLGDLPAAGGHVRAGLVYRSEGPRNFTSADCSYLAGLGIRTIVDLRSAGERTEAPHDWHGAQCTWLGLEVDADLRVFGDEGRERLRQGPEPEIAIETMKETYRSIPAALARHWTRIAEPLLGEGAPMMVNCTAGKDRTGVAIAFLLELAEVPREVIMQDYLLSRVFGETMWREGTIEPGFMGSYGFLPSRGQIDALVGVRPDYLEAAWAEVDRKWNGMGGYFEEAGLDRKAQSALRAALVA